MFVLLFRADGSILLLCVENKAKGEILEVEKETSVCIWLLVKLITAQFYKRDNF